MADIPLFYFLKFIYLCFIKLHMGETFPLTIKINVINIDENYLVLVLFVVEYILLE